MQATLTIAASADLPVIEVAATKLSPYSYQHYPKSAGVKGTLGDVADVEFKLTSGRDRFYAYFKRESRVEWFPITKAAFDAIRAGRAFTVALTDDAPAAPAPAATDAPPARAAKREAAAAK